MEYPFKVNRAHQTVLLATPTLCVFDSLSAIGCERELSSGSGAVWQTVSFHALRVYAFKKAYVRTVCK